MIRIVNGNILNGTENILCHQTNCIGIMGGGVALQVRKTYPSVYEEYKKCCERHSPEDMLGKVQLCKTNIPNRFIANCFGQLYIGSGLQTNYDALRKALSRVKEVASEKGYSVSIPYNIGCGLAGGDWNIVSKMIEEIFGQSSINCVLYKYGG